MKLLTKKKKEKEKIIQPIKVEPGEYEKFLALGKKIRDYNYKRGMV